MAFYEHTFIGKQDLSDKEVDSLITKYSNIIDKSGKIHETFSSITNPSSKRFIKTLENLIKS